MSFTSTMLSGSARQHCGNFAIEPISSRFAHSPAMATSNVSEIHLLLQNNLCELRQLSEKRAQKCAENAQKNKAGPTSRAPHTSTCYMYRMAIRQNAALIYNSDDKVWINWRVSIRHNKTLRVVGGNTTTEHIQSHTEMMDMVTKWQKEAVTEYSLHFAFQVSGRVFCCCCCSPAVPSLAAFIADDEWVVRVYGLSADTGFIFCTFDTPKATWHARWHRRNRQFRHIGN